MEIINQSGAIIGLLALVVGAGVYLFGTAKKGRRDYLRTDNLDLANSNTLLRQKIESLEESVKTLTATVANQRDIATQTPDVKLLLEATTNQQTLTATQHSEVIVKLTELTIEIAKLTKEFSHVAQAITKNSAAQTVNTAAQAKIAELKPRIQGVGSNETKRHTRRFYCISTRFREREITS